MKSHRFDARKSFLMQSSAAVVLLLAGCWVDNWDICAIGGCDDGDPCTTDTCTVDPEAGYVCANTPVDCGTQVCNPADGTCVDCVGDTVPTVRPARSPRSGRQRLS